MQTLQEWLFVLWIEGTILIVYLLLAYALYRFTTELVARRNAIAGLPPDDGVAGGSVQTVIRHWLEIWRGIVGEGRRKWIVFGVLVFLAWLHTGMALSRGVMMAFEGLDPGFVTDGGGLLLDMEWGVVPALVLSIALLGWIALFCVLARWISSLIAWALGSRVPVVQTLLQIVAVTALAWLFVRPVRLAATAAFMSSAVARDWLSGQRGISPAFLYGIDETWTSPILIITALWFAATLLAWLRIARSRGEAAGNPASVQPARRSWIEQGAMLVLTAGLFLGLLQVT